MTLYIDKRRYDTDVVNNASLQLNRDLRSTECCALVANEAVDEQAAIELSNVFAALSDPVRLRLLSIVAAGGEVCSCHLEGPLAKSQPTISHHTSVLAAAGLIVGQKRGRWVYWQIVPERLQVVAAFLST